MAKRSKISPKIAAEILARSARKCCLCKKPAGKNIQLHHIDGNPVNNDRTNLIPLCLNCHSEVQSQTAMGRGYSVDELLIYQKDCINNNEKNKRRFPSLKISDKHSNHILALLAINEVRRIRYKMELARRDWAVIENCMWELLPYGREYDYSVRSEIMSAAVEASDGARYGINADAVDAIVTVLMESIPIYHILYPSRHKITKKDTELIERALGVGHDLLWDACRYVRKPDVAERIMQFIHFILKYSHVNNLTKIKEDALITLRDCEEICDEENDTLMFPKIFPEGKQIIRKYRELALEPIE